MASNQTTTMFSYTPNQMPIFESEHSDYWSSQMETLFISQDLWNVVEEYYAEPSKDQTWTNAMQNEYKKNVKKDASALRFLQQGLIKSIYPRIHGLKKAKQAWEILKE